MVGLMRSSAGIGVAMALMNIGATSYGAFIAVMNLLMVVGDAPRALTSHSTPVDPLVLRT
jgi:hypothetical protein